MSKYLNLRILVLLATFMRPVVSWWLYAGPKGYCNSLTSCQDCVVEYSYDEYNISRPCTWCPATETCEMMNHYTGQRSEGSTIRDTCPILAENMPRCVYFTYSFWFNYVSAPNDRNLCNQTYVDDFCKLATENKVVEICNGDQKYIEPKSSGWGTSYAVILGKNPYGLEINLNYDVWFNAGYGEDRRRIETEVTALDDDTYNWLCQAAHQTVVEQAMVLKYRITADEPPESDRESMLLSAPVYGSGSGPSGHIRGTEAPISFFIVTVSIFILMFN